MIEGAFVGIAMLALLLVSMKFFEWFCDNFLAIFWTVAGLAAVVWLLGTVVGYGG